MELSKYIKSESVELNRSAIHFADYNPRKLSDESRKTLKRGIKKFGLVGGIVIAQLVGHLVRDQEVTSSNLVSPTILKQ